MKKQLFNNKKGNLAATILIIVVLFNIIMYAVIFVANSDESVAISSNYNEFSQELGANGSTTSDAAVSSTQAISFYSGFKISIFGMPWWVDIFYGLFQGFLVALSIFMLVRGND